MKLENEQYKQALLIDATNKYNYMDRAHLLKAVIECEIQLKLQVKKGS